MSEVGPKPISLPIEHGVHVPMQTARSRTPLSPRSTNRNAPLSILHVEDDTDDQILYQAAAKQAAVPIQWHVAESADCGISISEILSRATASTIHGASIWSCSTSSCPTKAALPF